MTSPRGKRRFEIDLTPEALADLDAVTDTRVRGKLEDRIDALEENPGLQGKPLAGVLSGYRSVRAVGQRYRIVYAIDETVDAVTVVVIGIRKDGDRRDAYRVAEKRLGD